MSATVERLLVLDSEGPQFADPWHEVRQERCLLVLGAQFADSERPRLVFWHEDHGDLEPLPDGGGLHVRYVTVGGERRVVLCGTTSASPAPIASCSPRHARTAQCGRF